ncbi:class I SAM-dependent methyltransferase [Pseudoroseicyclus sp. CXY001]|uniref:class I SAM-dependent methyltransferase n=1 Tax=Pseudoroseicyclus sp. CXY001 TaxID=3242492 RepID=UPI003570C17A
MTTTTSEGAPQVLNRIRGAAEPARSAADIAALLEGDALRIETDRSVEDTEAFCRDNGPWRSTFRFSNGVSTENFAQNDAVPNPRCMAKMRRFHGRADISRFAGKRVLDLGFNEGYNSIFMAKYLGCQVDGIEAYPIAITRGRKIADFCGTRCRFMTDDANTFVAPETYDLVLHCGILYHLPDVWSNVRNTCASLKPGGEVLLETMTYEGADRFDCKFINWHRKGFDNFWALSIDTVAYMFEEFGCAHVETIDSYEIGVIKDTGMKRTLMWFRKAA